MIHIYHNTECVEAFEMLGKNLTLWTNTTFKAEFSADLEPMKFVCSRDGMSCVFNGTFDFNKAYDKKYLCSFSLDSIIDEMIENEGKEKSVSDLDYITLIILITGRFDRVRGLLDEHGRYSDEGKFLSRNDHSETPIVEIAIRNFLNKISEALKCSVSLKRDFQLSLQHDVDHWDMPHSKKTLFRYLYNLILGRRSLRIRTLPFALSTKRRIHYLVNLALLNNLQPPILFLMQTRATRFDSGYKLSGSDIDFLRNLQASGVRIGLHPSYGEMHDSAHSDKRAAQHATELNHLAHSFDNKICDLRFHYLRSSDVSLQRLSSTAENLTDHSVSFVRKCGFSVGTTRPHYSIDIETRKVTPYLLQPLILMDSYLFGVKALNLNFDEASKRTIKLLNICLRFDIPFTILIHDDKLQNMAYRKWISNIYCLLGEEIRARAT